MYYVKAASSNVCLHKMEEKYSISSLLVFNIIQALAFWLSGIIPVIIINSCARIMQKNSKECSFFLLQIFLAVSIDILKMDLSELVLKGAVTSISLYLSIQP